MPWRVRMLIPVDAYQALESLRTSAGNGELAALCERHSVALLVVHGSVLQQEPLCPPRDLDLAYRYTGEATYDPITLINDRFYVACRPPALAVGLARQPGTVGPSR